MVRSGGGTLILVFALSVAAKDRPVTPAERYQAVGSEQQHVRDDRRRARTGEERKKVLARLGTLPQRFLELAEEHPKDPVAVEALIQTVSIVNGTVFPPGGKDTPGQRALA